MVNMFKLILEILGCVIIALVSAVSIVGLMVLGVVMRVAPIVLAVVLLALLYHHIINPLW